MLRHRIAILAVASLGACAATTPEVGGERPTTWAQPVERPGLPNLHRVSPTLFRGAQPEKPGYAELVELGIRTVVSLRDWHSDRSDIRGTSLGYERVGMTENLIGMAIALALGILPARFVVPPEEA